MSSMDWKRPLAGSTRIPLAPARFRGTLRRFVDEHLEPALPRPSAAVARHEAVIAHALKADETLLVRSTSGYKQEDETRTASGRRLRMTDNSPPWWIHAVAFSGATPPDAGLSDVLDDVWCWMFRTRSRPSSTGCCGLCPRRRPIPTTTSRSDRALVGGTLLAAASRPTTSTWSPSWDGTPRRRPSQPRYRESAPGRRWSTCVGPDK